MYSRLMSFNTFLKRLTVLNFKQIQINEDLEKIV
jgi:hypothetical protein